MPGSPRRAATCCLPVAQRGALVAGQDAGAVDEDLPPAQAGEQRLSVAEPDERRVVLDARAVKLQRRLVGRLPVELEPRARVAGLDHDADDARSADDERRAAA